MKKGSNKIATIPSYQFEETSDENIKRFVDRYGDWTHYWLKPEARFVKAVNHILNLGFNKGPRFAEYLLSVSKEEAKKKLETAGEEGSRTHSAIRDLIGGMKVTMSSKYLNEQNGRMEVLTPEEWDNLVAFEVWCKLYQPQIISNEFTVASSILDYAGSPDGLMVITVPSGDKVFDKAFWGKEVLLLPDWKTSSAIRLEYRSQVAAYWEAMVEQKKFAEFVNAFEGRTFTGILRLGTKHKNGGYEMVVWNAHQTTEGFLTFIAAKKIADTHQPKFEPVIEQAPTMFFIKFPKAKVTAPKKKAAKKPKLKGANKQLPL